MESKYVKLHNLLRMFGALLAIVVFVSMFVSRHAEVNEYLFFDFKNGFFFNDADADTKGNWVTFVGYILVLLGGLAGLAFVFVDELLGKDLTKKLSFVAGGVVVLGGLTIVLAGVLFRAFNSDYLAEIKTCAAPIVFGILAMLAGLMGAAAPILEDKGL